jgi:hypothetical protein
MKYKTPEIGYTSHPINKSLCKAFRDGCGGNMVKADDTGDYVATYGILRGAAEAMQRAKEFWYMDHGYFHGPTNNYWRIIRNNTSHSGEGEHNWDRFNNFNLKLNDWKTNGSNIVISPPSKAVAKFAGKENWLDAVLSELNKITDRKVVISRKTIVYGVNPHLFSDHEEKLEKLPLEEALKDAWVLITENSNAMLEAAMQGVPIISTDKNRKIGSIYLVEEPPKDRSFLKNLAYNQWTLDEIKSGKAWEELNEWG